MDSRSSPLLVTFGLGISPGKAKRSTVKIVTQNISKTVTDTTLDPGGVLDSRNHGLSIGTVRLTLDDLEWSKLTPKSEKLW